jgi:nucleoside-diphosphate-sugar epimerase
MRVFVAGATGVVGRRLVPRLVAQGHQVTATTRDPGKQEQVRRLGAEPAVMDGLDGAAVGEAVAKAEPDAIIHQMTAIAGKMDLRHFDRWFSATNALRTKGTEHLLTAAQAVGVQRFIAQSYTGWPNARTGGPVKTERDPLDPDPVKAQRETLAAIQFLERAVTQAPLQGIVLRYGMFYGPGASEQLVELVRGRKFPVVGGGTGVTSWTHVDDAAEAAVAALERGEPGIYNVVDDEPATVAEWLPFLAEAVGAKRPPRVPARLGRLLAGQAAVRMMTEVRGASNQKAKQELGWRPTWRTWRDGFRGGLTDPPGAATR